MYRPKITSLQTVRDALEMHRQCARDSGLRHLVVIELPQSASFTGLKTGDRPGVSPHQTDAADRINAWLGTNRSGFVWLGADDWRLAELAAAVGTLEAGGVGLVVLACNARQESALLRRWLERIAAYAHHHTGTPYPTPEMVVYTLQHDHPGDDWLSPIADSLLNGASARLPPSQLAVNEQDHLLNEALNVLGHGDVEHADPALVIVTGERGTGKSALLGRICAQLIKNNERVLVTAPRREACTTLLSFAGSGSALRHTPIDVALHAEPSVVIVDEAASLPASQLRELLAQHPKAILATTTDGYESGGRAFALLGLEALLALRPIHRHLRTHHPMRWSTNDPVDRVFREAFLLPEAFDKPPYSVKSVSRPNIQVVSAAHLLDREGLIRAFVDLMNTTHYQSSLTATDDMLSGRMTLILAMDGQCLLGALAATAEHAPPIELHADIIAGRRRLKNHLLPQLLARCADDQTALEHDYMRVVRIAVDARARRHGIGRALLQHLQENHAPRSAVGAVFAATSASLAFWRACGFRRFHIGQRINPRSGCASAAVLHAQNASLISVLETATLIHNDNQRPALSEPQAQLDSQLLDALLSGRRGLAETRASVFRLWERCTTTPVSRDREWPEFPGLDTSTTKRQQDRKIIQWVRQQIQDQGQCNERQATP